MGVAGDLLKLMFRRSGPERKVSVFWLAKHAKRMDRAFRGNVNVSSEPDSGELQQVTVNGAKYAWPANSPFDDLITLASEQGRADHPHRYFWGNTQVKAGDVVMDVGACEGSFSAEAAEHGAHPIAVEPSRFMQGVIKRLFELRSLPQPTFAACLLGSRAGEYYFVDNIKHPGSSRVEDHAVEGGYPVPMKTIDQLVDELALTRLDFIKCDAEGADLEILRGATDTLKRLRPKIAFTTYHADDHYNAMHDLLAPHGYQIAGKGFLRAITNGVGKFRVQMIHAWPA